jgi:IMP cyclohydrolase
MTEYNVYAKKIQNNIGDEPTFVGTYESYDKKSAISKAANDAANQGIYQNDTFFAICKVWKFEAIK